jgi:hypothetical protein
VMGRLNRGERSTFANFPVYFPVSREFSLETGPTQTASSANLSHHSLLCNYNNLWRRRSFYRYRH